MTEKVFCRGRSKSCQGIMLVTSASVAQEDSPPSFFRRNMQPMLVWQQVLGVIYDPTNSSLKKWIAATYRFIIWLIAVGFNITLAVTACYWDIPSLLSSTIRQTYSWNIMIHLLNKCFHAILTHTWTICFFQDRWESLYFTLEKCSIVSDSKTLLKLATRSKMSKLCFAAIIYTTLSVSLNEDSKYETLNV